jgi:hypothetical protein
MPAAMFLVTVSAQAADEAIEKVARRLPAGFAVTGQTGTRSARHGLMTVEVENLGGDVNDCWFWLTSYGMSPDKALKSRWQKVQGVGR